jgi:hypothetical protein
MYDRTGRWQVSSALLRTACVGKKKILTSSSSIISIRREENVFRRTIHKARQIQIYCPVKVNKRLFWAEK